MNNSMFFKMYDDSIRYRKVTKGCPKCGEPIDPGDAMCDECWEKEDNNETEKIRNLERRT